jgi:hypothetical protein
MAESSRLLEGGVGMSDVESALTEGFGAPIQVVDDDAAEIGVVWTVGEIELALAVPVRETRARALWRIRQAKRATPLLLVYPEGETVRVLGPRDANEPIRSMSPSALIRALQEARDKGSRREAAAFLADALERGDRTGIPGVVIRGLLTKHVLTRRLRRYRQDDWQKLQETAERLRPGRDWRENLTALGYRAEELQPRGYLLRHEERPLAVVIPLPDAGAFSRTTDGGQLPEGLLVADCRKQGVEWGLLATQDRFRLFPAHTSVGAATGRYLELDITETQDDDWAYIGLLAPESLEPGGLLERLMEESIALGNELRDTVEQQLRERVLPAIARGLGDYLAGPLRGESLASPNTRKYVEQASLLLMFRILFFLYLESRGFLPYSSAAYRPHSATQLLADARSGSPTFDEKATLLWDRFVTLVKAMRSGSSAWGIPAYNGDLFAPATIEGAELLEEASLPDPAFGPALAALAFDPEGEDGAGVDYGDLEIAHLGLIYEGLLSLRLSLADADLVFDARADRWMPTREGQEPEVREGELFYQTQSGGRKAAGVYYTPQVIVRHLVDNAVLPALDEHLQRVAEVADRNVLDAAAMLFDFRVLDPAMGSAHFLADALDRIAERIGTFLADRPLAPVSSMLDELRAEAKWEGRIEDGDLFRRLVLKRCIFGVDLSDMAVEVAKVSLWLASFVPGLSLAYLGHNLRQGDALVGVADIGVLADLGPFFAEYENAPIPQALTRAREVAQRIAEMPDRTPDEVEASRQVEQELNGITDGLVKVFDVWCSEPFGAKGARDWIAGAADKVLDGTEAKREDEYLHPAFEMARERSFFHWPAEFPEVFMRENEAPFPEGLTDDADRLFRASLGGGQAGLHEVTIRRPGFDVVIGNPPWEELTIEELAFYALHDPGLRGIRSETERRRRIEELDARYPYLRTEFEKRQRELEAKRAFFGPRGGYVIQGSGDTDLYKLFCERYGALTRTGGRLGVVLPRSAFLVDGSRGFRRWLFTSAKVKRLDIILNNKSWAFPIHPQYTIALLTAKRQAPLVDSVTVLTGPSASQGEFEANTAGDGVPIRLEQLAGWTEMEGGPGFEVPLLPTPEAPTLFDKMRAGPRFDQGYEGSWSAFPVAELHETNDKSLFKHRDGVPVWKGRSFDQYDPHGADPAGHAKRAETLKRLQSKRMSTRSAFKGRFPAEVLKDEATHPFHDARVAFRDVTNRTNSRTVLACLIPPEIFLTNKAPYLAFAEGGPVEQAFVLGVLNSLPFDWQARRLVETTLNFFLLNMLCFPPPERTDLEAIAERAARLSCVDDRFAEFAEACGVKTELLDPEERSRLIAEIDALVAHAYGLDEADLEVVFSDFTVDAVPDGRRADVREAFERPV